MTRRGYPRPRRGELGLPPMRRSAACGLQIVESDAMNWLVFLGIAVVVAGVAAVTGVKAKGTRPVAHTRMMRAGRISLLVIVAILAYLAFRARSGG